MVELRKTLLLLLDDLLAVTHKFIHPAVSRSGLERCLRRHGISTLKALMPQEESAKTPDLFAAIDRAARLGLRGDPWGQVGNRRKRLSRAPD